MRRDKRTMKEERRRRKILLHKSLLGSVDESMRSKMRFTNLFPPTTNLISFKIK